jgi:hypothetical protein
VSGGRGEGAGVGDGDGFDLRETGLGAALVADALGWAHHLPRRRPDEDPAGS